jgi:hypothetical protein
MMEKNKTYCLQSRWRLEGGRLIYYGLRAKSGRLLKNEIRVSARRAAILSTLPRSLSDAEKKTLGELLDDAVVELALDTGVLLGGSREQPLCEVEVELKSGEPEKAVAFAEAMAKEFGLRSERKSKFRRALALAKGE